jgi:hypothetical protein
LFITNIRVGGRVILRTGRALAASNKFLADVLGLAGAEAAVSQGQFFSDEVVIGG